MSNNDFDTEEFESQQVYGNSAPITAFMNDEIISVSPTASLREAAIALEEGGVGCRVRNELETVDAEGVGVVICHDPAPEIRGAQRAPWSCISFICNYYSPDSPDTTSCDAPR